MVGLDVSLFLDNSVSDQSLLSVVLSSLGGNSLFGLLSGVLVSDGILSNGDSLMSVLVSVVSSAHSVDTRSFNLFVLLLRVVRSGLDGSIGSVVSLPGGSDLGQSSSVGSDQSGDLSNVLLVFFDLTLD